MDTHPFYQIVEKALEKPKKKKGTNKGKQDEVCCWNCAYAERHRWEHKRYASEEVWCSLERCWHEGSSRCSKFVNRRETMFHWQIRVKKEIITHRLKNKL